MGVAIGGLSVLLLSTPRLASPRLASPTSAAPCPLDLRWTARCRLLSVARAPRPRPAPSAWFRSECPRRSARDAAGTRGGCGRAYQCRGAAIRSSESSRWRRSEQECPGPAGPATGGGGGGGGKATAVKARARLDGRAWSSFSHLLRIAADSRRQLAIAPRPRSPARSPVQSSPVQSSPVQSSRRSIQSSTHSPLSVAQVGLGIENPARKERSDVPASDFDWLAALDQRHTHLALALLCDGQRGEQPGGARADNHNTLGDSSSSR